MACRRWLRFHWGTREGERLYCPRVPPYAHDTRGCCCAGKWTADGAPRGRCIVRAHAGRCSREKAVPVGCGLCQAMLGSLDSFVCVSIKRRFFCVRPAAIWQVIKGHALVKAHLSGFSRPQVVGDVPGDVACLASTSNMAAVGRSYERRLTRSGQATRRAERKKIG